MNETHRELPFDAVIFDLDGVITRTAKVHSRAWKDMFDEYLRVREKKDGEPFREFTHEGDYLPYVDGKPRYEGVSSFLESRGIAIPYGDPSDPPDRETVCGLGNKKNEMVLRLLRRGGVEVYSHTIGFIRQLKQLGIRIGVASSSKNCREILQSADIEDLFETRVDGVVSAELGLKGKPEGDIFVRAAADLGALPARAIVVEDAVSGVQAGRNGGFGLVVGVARHDNQDQLLEQGADVTVTDFSVISPEWCRRWFHKRPVSLAASWQERPGIPRELRKDGIRTNPCFLRSAEEALFSGKRPVFFLDYDGTLTPIVSRPDLAVISPEMKETVVRLSEKYTTAIVSGRMRDDVAGLVGIEQGIYAGSHGFDIAGPGISMVHPEVENIIPSVDKAIAVFKEELSPIEGVLIEEKKFSVAVHYRLADEKHLPRIRACVEKTVGEDGRLRFMEGKKVFEVLPALDWNKGKAIRWLMQALSLPWEDSTVVYIGDDTTDEDAFRAVRTRGTGILVSAAGKESCADFYLESPEEVRKLFEKIISRK